MITSNKCNFLRCNICNRPIYEMNKITKTGCEECNKKVRPR